MADSYHVSGRVDGETAGNGVASDRFYSAATGRLRSASVDRASVIAPPYQLQQLSYEYDAIGNVKRRFDAAPGVNRDERFYNADPSDGYDGLDRLKVHRVIGGATVTVSYDQTGNITNKSDVGGYTYSGVNAGPHAVTTAGIKTYQYDANGNMYYGGGRTIEWTSFNQMRKATDDGTGRNSEFFFGAGHERVKQLRRNGTTLIDTTLYLGSAYEKVTTAAGGLVEHKHYIMAPTGRIAVFTDRSDLTKDTRFFHTDGLGSITVVTDEKGTVLKRYTYDAWGKQSTLFTAGGGATNTAPTTRGFTDHEMLSDLGLVHMNGRVFDPVLGRFLSADPNVDDSGDSQAFNRYSYVSNNPLNHTDPSGYFKLSFKTILKIVAVVVISVVTYGAASGAAMAGMTATAATATTAATYSIGGLAISASTAGVIAGVAGGAAAGFASGFAGSLLNGGSIGDAFKSGVVGAAAGMLVGGVQGYYGNVWNAGRVVASGVAGGAGAEIMGSDFRTGFYMAAGFAALRWGWEGIKNSVDSSSLKSTYNKDFNPNAPSPQYDENGYLRTDGKRLNVYAGNVRRYPGNWFTNTGMEAEASGLHDYDPGMWMERRLGADAARFVRTSVNLISKIHDWQNSWNYDQLGRYIMRGEVFDTLFQGYSFLGMPVAAAATGAIFVGNSPWAQQQLLREREQRH